jgi:putative transposase
MPNATRYLESGYTYHLTHRCHDRRYLLKFARDRDLYRKWLREGARRYSVPVYNYCITSNHVHVVVHVEEVDAVASMMQLASATVARNRNRRKAHEGSVWEHPYKCTRIQDGQHLLNCLRYVSLNMVRAGVVSEPGHWRWCGHDELVGQRQRYRILSLDRLLQSLDMSSVTSFREVYLGGIAEALQEGVPLREAAWTESLAVGGRVFVEQAAMQASGRSRFEYDSLAEGDAWVVREAGSVYSSISTTESGCKGPDRPSK